MIIVDDNGNEGDGNDNNKRTPIVTTKLIMTVI